MAAMGREHNMVPNSAYIRCRVTGFHRNGQHYRHDSSIEQVIKEKNVYIPYDIIKRKSTERSVGEFLSEIAPIYSLSIEELERNCHAHIDNRYLEVEAIKNAKEILDYLSNEGSKHLIYTHKGKSTHDILKNLDMDKYFEEVLTIEDGFKRKPDPEAINYFIDKYSIN